MSDFDFFGAPTTPPPSGPPSGGQFGAPATNQFGMPATNQFGMPATAPTAPTQPVGPPPGAYPPSDKGRQLAMLVAIVAVIVIAVGGWMWLSAQGKKTATKVSNAVETPIVKAHQTAETVDLQQAAVAEETYLGDNNTYATSTSQLTGFAPSVNDTITVVSATGTAYCLRADDTSNFHAPSMYLSSATPGASTTPCT